MLVTVDLLSKKLEERRSQNALRKLPSENDLVDFCSNDYLGLARCPLQIAETGDRQLTNGATGSRLISGNTQLAELLETELAAYHHAAAGLLFNSGYNANIGLLSCVPQRGDTILFDQLVHASIRDGIRLSNARAFSFRHNDLDHLKRRMDKAGGNLFIVVESIYSMDGDEAPLAELAEIAQACGALLIVDEAHATGVLGPQGKGIVHELGLEKAVFARVHTFGKAAGCHGAVVLGPDTLRTFLINFSRPFIYTTALPAHALQSIRWAFKHIASGEQIAILHQNIKFFQSSLSCEIKEKLIPGRSAIHSLIRPGNEMVKSLTESIQAQGFDVRPMLHPTVPMGQERLRICLHAFNTRKEIAGLANCLNRLAR